MLRSTLAMALLLLSVRAHAEEIEQTSFHKDNNTRSTLGFYLGGCSEDNIQECEAAYIECEERQLQIKFIGFTPSELAAWFTRDKSDALLATNSRRYKLQAFRIDYSDMNDSWDIVFRLSHDANDDVFQGMAMAKKLWLTVGKRELRLPVNKHLTQLVRACAAPRS